jgi:nucleotide-binding universal stress UspA family protein
MAPSLFARVLVPFDFTPAAEAALRAAAPLVADAGGDLTVLHVIAPFYPLRDLATEPGRLDAAALEARVLDRLESRVAALLGDAPVHCVVTTGNPGHRIVDAAAGMSCIVMPTTGRTGAAHALIGSTAERVVRFATTPVLVLPAPKRRAAAPAVRPAATRTRRLGLAVLLLLAGTARAGALGMEGPFGSQWTLKGSDRVRTEFSGWFDPAATTGPGSNADYVFVHNRFRLGVDVQLAPFEAYVEYQNTVLGAVPENGGGPGGVYYANTARATQVGNWVRQAWLRWSHECHDGPRIEATLGRQPYSDGAEATLTDPTLAWLQRWRVSERLIGPFDYTASGRAFDGLVAKVQQGPFDLTGMALQPTSGGYETDAGRNISEITMGGLALTLRDRPPLAGTSARLFWFYYDDNRPEHDDVVVLDNRPFAVRAADTENVVVQTYGLDLLHVRPLGPGRLDVVAWGAGQFGDWQQLEHSAGAFGVEGGYQFPDLWGQPWARIGYFRSSGDPDPDDDVHETFFQMLPTARLYAQTPFYNLMNSGDAFLQFLLKPCADLGLRSEFHWLQAVDTADFVYSGGGATKEDTLFGYAGLPSGGAGHQDLAYLLDLGITYQPKPYLLVYAYYGHAFGQDVIRANYADTQLDYGYVEVTLTF